MSLPDPNSAPELFENILERRVVAGVIDIIIISIIVIIVSFVLFFAGIATLGLAWLTMPIIIPFSILFYYATTLGSKKRATVGMQLLDIILVPTKGKPLDGFRVLIHPIIFWLTIWLLAPLLIIGLFTNRRQLLHDLITSTMMVRRSALEKGS